MNLPLLNEKFAARLLASITESREAGYNPRDFAEMLKAADAVELAVKLVTAGEMKLGLKELAKINRLDLSVECIMLEDEFKPLFDKHPGALEAAHFWLDQARKV